MFVFFKKLAKKQRGLWLGVAIKVIATVAEGYWSEYDDDDDDDDDDDADTS